MRRNLYCAAAVLAASAAAMSAQTRTPEGNTPIVVEGCLQNADKSGSLGGTPVGTTATPGNAGDIANNQELPSLFILTGARPVGEQSASGGVAVGTAGTARTRNADGSVTSETRASEPPKTYALVGNQNEFAVHNGHRVEVTGTLAPPLPEGARTSGTAGPNTGDPQAADVGAAGGAQAPRVDNSGGSGAFQTGTERITVTSIRPIANTCTQAR